MPTPSSSSRSGSPSSTLTLAITLARTPALALTLALTLALALALTQERLAKLSAVEATCSRLVTFPVPPSYHRHGSRAILLWLSSLPFVLEGLEATPLQTFLAVATTTWLLLGIDQIAIEVEQPLDVLPLHVFASNMAKDVRTVLASWATMPSLPNAGDDESLLGHAGEIMASPQRRASMSARSSRSLSYEGATVAAAVKATNGSSSRNSGSGRADSPAPAKDKDA